MVAGTYGKFIGVKTLNYRPAMKRSNITMFAQIVQRIDILAFQNLVNKFETDKHAKGIKTRDQLIAMLFCHFAGCESLREISDGLHACVGKLNHVDARPIGRFSLSYVNANRTYKLYEAFYYILLKDFESVLNGRVLKKRFKKPVYSLDSTLITLCLTLFDWARYRTSKGGIKLHTLLNNDHLVPEMIVMTDGKQSDIKVARKLKLPSHSIIIMDRGYNDYQFFKDLTDQGITFITRLKDNAQTEVLKEKVYKRIPAVDTKVEFTGYKAQRIFEENNKFRVVHWHDKEEDRWYEFLTNETNERVLKPQDIADFYKQRWRIEEFFRRVKQNLVIKSFVGTTPNAVMVQIWTAAIALLILEVLRNLSKYPWAFSRLVAYFRLNLMTCKDLDSWLEKPDIMERKKKETSPQYDLFSP